MHSKYIVPFGYPPATSASANERVTLVRGHSHSPLSQHQHQHQHHYSHSAAPSPSSYHAHHHHAHSASAVYFPHTPQHQHQHQQQQVHLDYFGFAAFAASSPHSLQQQSPHQMAHWTHSQAADASYATAGELACDHYMEFHRRTNNASDTTTGSSSSNSSNEFDFVLLPSARNARKGMKTLVSNDAIPCKYGKACFRKDCRFSHSQDEMSEVLSTSAPTSPAGLSSASSSPLTVSSDAASDSDSGSGSPTLHALRHSRTPSPVRRPAFHAHTDLVSVQH